MIDRDAAIVRFCLYLAAALVNVHALIQRVPSPLPLGQPAHDEAAQVTRPIAGLFNSWSAFC